MNGEIRDYTQNSVVSGGVQLHPVMFSPHFPFDGLVYGEGKSDPPPAFRPVFQTPTALPR